MSLARPVERLAKVVESKGIRGHRPLFSASRSTSFPHPPPHLLQRPTELVHEIEQLVRFAPADDVEAAQSALKNPSSSLLQGRRALRT